jgi:hypothetical protein
VTITFKKKGYVYKSLLFERVDEPIKKKKNCSLLKCK